MAKNKGGRPSKLNDKFLEVANRIVNEDINAIILSDEDLVFLINNELDENQRISDRTFQRWKAKEYDEDDTTGTEFCRIIKAALIQQRMHLFNKLRKDANSWTRWAWIIERKFTEWNIKHQHDVTSNGKELKQITGFKID